MATNQARTFRVGQEWEFQGRETDPRPSLVIVRIDSVPELGEIIHVSIRGVRIKTRWFWRSLKKLPHLPIARAALDRSVTRLAQDSVSLPRFEEGYAEWKRAQGGVFTISVREALDYAEEALRR